jgi:5-hydroxyisourate hydrolase-like protein (transthyretin family)
MVRVIVLCSAIAVGGAAQKHGTLKGKIEDEKGKPIAGAEVRAMKVEDRSLKETRTDQEGYYLLELEPGSYTVSFDAEGYQGGTLFRLQEVEAGKETRVKTIRLERAKRTSLIRGAVFDTQGRSLAGARVRLERILTASEKPLALERITNSRGEFAFRLPAEQARYRLTATLSGYKPDTKEIQLGESESAPVAFTLEPIKREP